MTEGGASDWAAQAAREGARVSADPGESGDATLGAPSPQERTFATVDSDPDAPPQPRDHLGAGGDPAEGGDAGADGFSPRSQPDARGGGSAGALTGRQDPAEGAP